MIKLRPITLNSSWEDEVDEYTGRSELDDRWDKEFGDDSNYKEYRKYIVPGVKLPDYVKIALKYTPETFNDCFWDFVHPSLSLRAPILGAVLVKPFGDNLLVMYKLLSPYSEDEYWDPYKNPKREYFSPEDIIKEVLDNFWYNENSKDWIIEKIDNTISKIRYVIKTRDAGDRGDVSEEEVLRTVLAGTYVDGKGVLMKGSNRSGFQSYCLSPKAKEQLSESDLSELWYKYARLDELYKKVFMIAKR